VSTFALRALLASAVPYAALAIFIGYAAYGVYLDLKVGEYRMREPPPKPERWNARYYAPGAEPWLTRWRRWHRRKAAVWLGCIAGGSLLYWMLKP
jgi:hypothetical protein